MNLPLATEKCFAPDGGSEFDRGTCMIDEGAEGPPCPRGICRMADYPGAVPGGVTDLSDSGEHFVAPPRKIDHPPIGECACVVCPQSDHLRKALEAIRDYLRTVETAPLEWEESVNGPRVAAIVNAALDGKPLP